MRRVSAREKAVFKVKLSTSSEVYPAAVENRRGGHKLVDNQNEKLCHTGSRYDTE